MSTTEPTSPTARTRVRRVAHRGHYDRTTLHAILDEAYVCHIAFADEHGVHCIPTACWREGDHLYICLLYTSPSPRDRTRSRMPSSA